MTLGIAMDESNERNEARDRHGLGGACGYWITMESSHFHLHPPLAI